jgi:hypothetical protein
VLPNSDRSATVVSKAEAENTRPLAFQVIVNQCEAVEESSVESAILHRK